MNSSVKPDVNFRSIYGEHGLLIDGLDLSPINGGNYSSPLKISHSQGVEGARLVIPQGLENAVDINVCDGVHLAGDFGAGGVVGDQVITVKASKNFTLDAVIHSRGARGYELCFGQWSDQDYSKTSNGEVTVRHVDGGKVRVAMGWVDASTIKLNAACHISAIESLKIKLYWILKYAVRKALRIPQGVKGPSWL